ncbi:MAG: YbhB/YbcL family Raf kinase inhibitor-like protein [Verrucomicrobiota bacterium]
MNRVPTFLLIAVLLSGGAGAVALASPAASTATTFVLRSPAVVDGGQLPTEYTGDGASATLPLEWSGAPAGTKSYAVIMHHMAPDKIKWYWLLYDIPASVNRLPKNVKGVGTLGNNSVNGKTEYAPPHSKGPGTKTYIYTVYALAAPPQIAVPPAEVSREVLLAAMRDLVIGSAELSVDYTRFPAPVGNLNHEGAEPRPPNDK